MLTKTKSKSSWSAKANAFKNLQILPNDLACLFDSDLLLVFCTKTSMLAYAAKVKLKISDSKQIIEVGANTFYKEKDLWI
jgi:hypothetical protein